ncbi:MAG: ATP-dependent DNA helicase [Nanoarchaeota archaeon]|nr:ATP-dependent DNA helicase [Nanoarchaeota archaeon]
MILFPHDKIRDSQSELIKDIQEVIEHKKHIIAHAPTGLGKTAASLAPALAHAIKNDLTIFFLTSRHTQHVIAIDTLKKIKQKHQADIVGVDIIGKKWMCIVPGTDLLTSFEFSEYCKHQRDEGQCDFYTNTKDKNKPTVRSKKLLSDLKVTSPHHTEEMIDLCLEQQVCPYEITTLLSSKANIVVADYNYIFNPTIRDTFFKKTDKSLESSIVIVDEAHNLPLRVRDMLTQNLNSITLSNAIKEAQKNEYKETASILVELLSILRQLSEKLQNNECLIEKQEFIDKVNSIGDYHEILGNLEFVAGEIREKQKRSFIGSIAQFLVRWEGEDKGFARILSKNFNRRGQSLTLSYRCLDPSIITGPIIEQTHSTILMSGTLTPTSMYKDVLGFPDDTLEKEYPSPFPPENRLNLIVPETTTKYTMRNEAQYKRIAEITADIVNTVPGNTAIFFPSYYLRDEVNKYFTFLCKKTTFSEQPGLSKDDKLEILEKFKDFKKIGSVLLGVYSGSFGEGVDFPGDLLKAVIVVGLPLNRPDLETKKLIEYYDDLFGKGWDYGYLFPAMNRCFQSAGRCIRSETDRGTIVFLDNRFTWPNYFRTFPASWELKISKDYENLISNFFQSNTDNL